MCVQVKKVEWRAFGQSGSMSGQLLDGHLCTGRGRVRSEYQNLNSVYNFVSQKTRLCASNTGLVCG